MSFVPVHLKAIGKERVKAYRSEAGELYATDGRLSLIISVGSNNLFC